MAPAAPTSPLPPARPLRIALEGELPAAHAALLVREDAHPFALTGVWAGASALAGAEPLVRARRDDDPFALLDAQPALTEPPPPDFVGGGWFGFLGYGLGARLEPLGPPPPAPERLPAFVLGFHDHLLRRDAGGRWWFEALWTAPRAAALDARLAVLRTRLRAGASPRPVRIAPFRATPGPEGHARAVEACRERIAAGDLFQANLALRLRSRLPAAEAADLHARGAAALAPDRSAFLAGPWGALASLSPELFLERHGDRVRSAPIKGTRPRGADPAALAASPKDRAENIMIVDLVRNDLGRSSVYGSVAVAALAEPRPHAGVWHLVSEVTARVREDVGDGALVAGAFPPGSVTGAPKVAAMDIISALEGTARQAFCGAIGFASPAAGLELSVAIRTFELAGGALWLDVGGGIVADSDPAAEEAEALAKAAPLLTAVGATLEDAPPAGRAPRPLRLGPHPVPRPDPAAGIFETILIRDGEPVALDEHLARLAASAAALGLPAPELVLPALPRRGRLRIVLDATGTHAETADLPAAGPPVALRSVAVPGGLGEHKWRDRRLLDALGAAVAPELPLLVDLDGLVLEASRANIIILLADGTLATPPLDGRILPGTTRARVLAGASPVLERPVALEEVRGALLTGALRGVEPVAVLDGAPLSPVDPAAVRPRAAAGTR